MTILIVDDDELMRHAIKDWLTQEGYQTAEAENGQEALEMARRQPPDLIIMDLRMPVLNGIAATKRIREEINLQHIPVIVTTGLDAEIFREEALSVGCNAFISKPIDLTELSQLLDSFHRPAP